MNFRFIIEGTYQVDTEDVQREYGTVDPVEIALLDLRMDPTTILEWATDVTMHIEPAE